METKFLHMTDVKQDVNEHLKNINEQDYKWFYCYFNGFDEWPLIVPRTVKLEEDE